MQVWTAFEWLPVDDNIIDIGEDIKNITVLVFDKEQGVSMRACETKTVGLV